jgi:hypothetical protein
MAPPFLFFPIDFFFEKRRKKKKKKKIIIFSFFLKETQLEGHQ